MTRDVVRAALAGTSLGATAARTAGLGLHVVDAGVSGVPSPVRRWSVSRTRAATSSVGRR